MVRGREENRRGNCEVSTETRAPVVSPDQPLSVYRFNPSKQSASFP